MRNKSQKQNPHVSQQRGDMGHPNRSHLMVLGLLLALAISFCPRAGAQGFGTVQPGPLTGVNCPGAPLLGIDIVDNGIYSCGTNGKGFQLIGGAMFVLAAPGTSTVINTATALNGSTVAIGAGLANVASKKLVYEGWGTYSITTGTPTLALAFKLGATTLATCTSSATTNGVTTFPFYFKFTTVTTTTGATGTDEAHCSLTVVLGGAAGGAASTFLDNNTAASTGYDHTVANNFTIAGLAAGASNAALLRDLTVTVVN